MVNFLNLLFFNMNNLNMAAFVLSQWYNLLGNCCESTNNNKKEIYSQINSKSNHKNIQNEFKIPDLRFQFN